MGPIFVIKGNGQREPFDETKLERSLKHAGASSQVIAGIVADVKSKLTSDMRTKTIYKNAFAMLKEREEIPVAARYSLRRAVMELGPSGFPFESLVGELFKANGYAVEIGVTLKGQCIKHEVDVVAKKENSVIFVEAKFHNNSGFKTDAKTSLYVQSRAHDLRATDCGGMAKEGESNSEFWLVTNTKFTHNAIDYGTCVGLTLIGWGYPHTGNLESRIEKAGLHPLTCLTTLSGSDKRTLFDKGLVLCRNVKGKPDELRGLGLSHEKTTQVLEEAERLCVSR